MARKLINIEEELNGSEGLRYEYFGNKDSYAVVSIGECVDEEICIPDMYDGLYVTDITENAFYGDTVKKIILHEYISEVSPSAFSGCSALETITVSPLNPYYMDIDGVLFTKDGKKIVAFPRGKEESVYTIPKEVSFVGTAFSDKAFSRIDVDPRNKSFKSIDGNLYSGDGSRLIRYATGRTDDTFELPKGTTEVCECAFAGNEHLRRVILHSSVKKVDRDAFVGCTRVIAYCKSKKQPSEWHKSWAKDAQVVWNFNGKAKKAKSYLKVAESRNKRHRAGLIWKTVLFSLPVLAAGLVALDLFVESHGLLKALRESKTISFEFAMVLFGLFAAGCIAATATLISKMWLNEGRRGRYNYRPMAYNISAAIVVVLLLALVGVNQYEPLSHIKDSRVKFTGGNYNSVEYMEPGESIILESTSKDDKISQDFVTKYTFECWEIDGEMYYPGTEYTPQGWVKAKAVFKAVEWCRITFSTSGASVSVSYNGISRGSFTSGESVEVPRGIPITLEASFSYSDTSFSVGGTSVYNPYTFTIEKHTSVSASSSDPGCLVEGTKVLLANGTYKDVDKLQQGDVLMIFNHETGKYDTAPLLVNVHANTPAQEYEVMSLTFSDGQSIRIADAHGLFDKTEGGYIQMNPENCDSFIGHTFVSSRYENGEMVSYDVTLLDVDVTKETVKVYNPVSLWHLNLVADGMLTMSSCVVDIFKYDENMKYDMKALEADIEEYGLYTYEELSYFISPEEYTFFPFKYYKIAVGKGLYTESQLKGVVDLYHHKDSVNGLIP